VADETDIVMGTPVAGPVHPTLESVIGLFVSTVVLRTHSRVKLNVTIDFV
jgi:non-ribosomal peptide synthetase component F